MKRGITGADAEVKATKWHFNKTDFSEKEKKELLAKVIEIAIKTTFRNHLYQFEGKCYVQAEGGSIGLRLTGVVAKLVMSYWMRCFKELAVVNNLQMYLNKMYVDDINLLMEAIKPGSRWNGESLEWRQEWEEEDLESKEQDDKRTMREIRHMSNSILPFIKLKEEVASDCKEGKLPMLDFAVWREDDEKDDGEKEVVIKHEFYEKPVASKLVMMSRSALPQRMKITTLTQEIIRRQKNTARNVGKKRRSEILTRLMVKMKRSGYDQRMRNKILLAGMKGYERMVKAEQEDGRISIDPDGKVLKKEDTEKLVQSPTGSGRGKEMQKEGGQGGKEERRKKEEMRSKVMWRPSCLCHIPQKEH